MGAGLVAVGGVFSGIGGCLAFFASELVPTRGCGHFRVLRWLGWRFREQARFHRGVVG